MTTVAIIQARMTSTRLPGKVMADLCGEPLLSYMLRRVARSAHLDGIWVATTTNPEDDPVAALCKSRGIPVFRGDEADVLGRYTGAAREAEADTIIRLTADCPMIDPAVVDAAIETFRNGGYDYLSNSIRLSYPDGLDVEVFTRGALEEADAKADLPFHREHVTPYMRTGIYGDEVPTGDFKVGQMTAPADFSHLRWTVDTQEDLDRVRALVAELPPDYGWLDVIALLTRRPDLLEERPAPRAAVSLRPATTADAALLHGWVNRPDSLANKLATADAIPRDAHETWLAAKLDSEDAAIWIGEINGDPVGQVRLERRGDGLEVDIYVDGAARGQGAGIAMLEAARTEAAARWPGVPLLARIKPENMASRRLFTRAGYGSMTVAPDHVILRRAAAAPEDKAAE